MRVDEDRRIVALRRLALGGTLAAAALAAVAAASPAGRPQKPAPKGKAAAGAAAGTPRFERDVRPLLAKYCVPCHGSGDKPAGGVGLAAFRAEEDARRAAHLWAEVHDVVRAKSMPPAGMPQPTDAERKRLLDWIEQARRPAGLKPGERDPGPPVLRRLTRLEYNNTVRDLLGMRVDVFTFPERLAIRTPYYAPPAKGGLPERIDVSFYEYGAALPALLRQAGLPGDNRTENGFSNRGDALNVTPLLLEKYLEVAGQILDHPDLLRQSPVLRDLLTPPGQRPPTFAPAPEGKKAADPGAGAKAGGPVNTGGFAPADNVSKVAPGAPLDVAGVRAAVAAARAKGTGGVFAVGEEFANTTLPAGAELTLKYGDSGRALVLRPGAPLWMTGFGTVRPASPPLVLANHAKGQKTYDVALGVTGGKPGEGVTLLAVSALSRNGQQGDVTMTAHFSGGGSRSLTAALAPGAGASNTLFSFVAPAGERIERLGVDGAKFSGDYLVLDDVAFATDSPASPPPAAPPAAAKPASVPAATPAPAKAAPPKPAVPADDTALARRLARERAMSEREVARERLAGFLPRAFRRPVGATEAERYLALYDAAKREGADFPTAMKRALRAVLASPQFLFLAEGANASTGGGGVRALGDHELASRLSYFLWASMPDDELLSLAAAGRLKDPAVLEAQVRRMVRDPKAREMGENFAAQWLHLPELFSARPDRKAFSSYYFGAKGTMAQDMMMEALLLFDTVLVEDRSVLDFVDADYAYLNKSMMRFYGFLDHYQPMLTAFAPPLPPGAEANPKKKPNAGNRELPQDSVPGSTWFRVKLPDRTRGGFVTMGATLALTSFPQRTSPVRRGAWVLESILNSPPPPPPANVPALEEQHDDGSAKTVRQRLERHRRDPACAPCHARIDPPGFALENFDAVGRWRETDGGAPVDASGAFADGGGGPAASGFAGPKAFKAALRARRDEIARGFVEHLLSYALGRRLEPSDAPAVREIVAATKGRDYPLQSLLVETARSYPFRHARAGVAPGDTSEKTLEKGAVR